MTHSTTLQSVPQSTASRLVAQSRFLIIGCGDKLRGDAAVGPRVADVVADWHLPSLKTISACQLRLEFVNDLALTEYAIFVNACKHPGHTQTAQLNPLVAGSQPPQELPEYSHGCNPLSLLNLTQQLYGRMPLAWLLNVPVENFDFSNGLSSTTQKGCDHAVRIIEQFLRTYGQPTWMV